MTAAIKSIFLLILVYCFFVIVALNLWNNGLSGIVGSADLIQPYLVTEDLLKYPDTYHRWRHSPAPYVFPDWFIAGILMLTPSTPIWKNILYAAAVASGFALTAGWIVTQVTRTPYIQAVSICAVTLIVALLGSIALGENSNFEWVFLTLLAPFIHNGASFGLLLALALTGRVWSGSHLMLPLIFLGLVVFLTAYSDLLFVIWFVLPAAATFMLRAMVTGRISPVFMAFFLFAIALPAVFLKRSIHRVNSVKSLDADNIHRSVDAFGQEVQSKIENGDVAFILLFAGVICVAVVGVGALISSIRTRNMTFAQALLIFLPVSLVCAIVAPVFGAYFEGPAHWRYFVVVPLIIALSVSLLIAHLLPRKGVITAFPSTFLALLILWDVAPAYQVATALKPKIELETCLEAEGLTTGFGEYWMSKNLIFYSERRIHIIQVDGHGGLYSHNYNRIWFERRADGKPLDEPNFVIMKGLHPERISELFGDPKRRIICDGQKVWIYERITHPSLVQLKK